MTENPQLRRGPSGPMAESSGGSEFEPFDNSYYFDPDYVDGAENGSIAGPFVTWAQMVAAVAGSTVGRQVYFPGYPVSPGAEEIPTDGLLVLQGQTANESSSYIDDTITLGNNGGASQSVTFRDLELEALALTGGTYPITFERCRVADIDIVTPGSSGTIYGFDSSFSISQDTPDFHVQLVGGNLLSWVATTFDLTDLIVGSTNLASAGEIEADGTSIVCRGVTFAPGSTIEFTGETGTLFLDPESYKSFLDNDIELTNGGVVRLDGSWPQDALSYDEGEDINFTKNPRAIYRSENGPDPQLVFLPPLTREVQLLVMYDAGGEGGPVDFPANVIWTEGNAPDQITTIGSISLFRFDFEEATNTYIGWVVGMDLQ